MFSFSNSAKVACVRPIYKKDDRTKIKIYRPVSFLNCYSKIYEKFLNEQLLYFLNHSLYDFMSVENVVVAIVLIWLIENWRKALDNNLFTEADLMDLSKAFDYISHDLVIAKLHA